MKNYINISKTPQKPASGKRIPGIRFSPTGSSLTTFSLLLLLVLACSFQLNGIDYPAPNQSGFWIITIEDDLLLTDSGSLEDDIIELRIYQSQAQITLVYAETGCYMPACISDLSHLERNSYFVVVITESGSFSDTIQLE